MTDTRRRGLTLVEVMIVCTIGIILLLPIINFLIMTQKSAYKGLDRLETLAKARIVLEKAQRDLKNFCFNDTTGMTVASTAAAFSAVFPVFPAGNTGPVYTGDENPVNLVTYTFDRAKKTLVRSLKIHPRLAGGFSAQPETLATNVGQFSIERRVILGQNFYDIRILILPSTPYVKNAPTELRTSVRSEYESRLERHPNFITNRRSVIDLPPP
ncbi:MAG: hypothetical protein GX442_14690 [Candidatus Riflebacteria bacterium]|nr:hypothetical protein [Candidatus Riflebacteria bacterium]